MGFLWKGICSSRTLEKTYLLLQTMMDKNEVDLTFSPELEDLVHNHPKHISTTQRPDPEV